jgi:tetratricopeptide (TPR) repeat protein
MKSWIVAGSAVGAIFCGTQGQKLTSIVNPPVRIVGLEAQDTHAAASLLGQFRTSISGFLYLRSDLYVHGGVEMRPMTKDEENRGRQDAKEAHDEAVKLDGSEPIVTVVPSEREDFRGIFGDVEREVASYKPMEGHHHESPTKALPLFSLMTWADPQFIEGWTSAAQIILWENKKDSTDIAVQFLQRGLDQNPESIDILSEMAFCYLRSTPNPDQPGKRYDKALPYLERAKRIGLDNLKVLSQKEAESLKENFRRLCICYRELKMEKELKSTSEQGLKIFGEDISLRKALTEAERNLINP